MKFLGREEKKNRTIIKCEECGFKYYKGDAHKCPGYKATDVREEKEEKIEDKQEEEKETKKTGKKSSKIW
jgi:hypothetical protein